MDGEVKEGTVRIDAIKNMDSQVDMSKVDGLELTVCQAPPLNSDLSLSVSNC